MFASGAPHDLVYLVGPPGVGKSTTMAALTEGLLRQSDVKPFALDWLVQPGSAKVRGVELGARREKFSGTDALGMSVNPRAIAWISDAPVPTVLGEGDRLANVGFLSAAARAGYDVTLVHLLAGPSTLAKRRAQRGSDQNEQWMKGRATKAENLAEHGRAEGWHVMRIDSGVFTPEGVARLLRAQIPALRALVAA